MINNKKILIVTSFPPRKCGIATYSQDLIQAIEAKFDSPLSMEICALIRPHAEEEYPKAIKYFLNTSIREKYTALADAVNLDDEIVMVFIQHEFGLYGGDYGSYLLDFLSSLNKPIITTFHTVLPAPDENRKVIVQDIASLSDGIIVMTRDSQNILIKNYGIDTHKIKFIPHGTHLITPSRNVKSNLSPFSGKMIFSTFGLISEGKGIETALEAIPQIVEKFPNIIYLIIGKTHPEVIKHEGERYRDYLHEKVRELKIEKYVVFVNKYLSLDVLLEYLETTDIYLFTSKDPQQAVSGTLSYAMSAGCPVISTPIPHAIELIEGAGIKFDFGDSKQLAEAAILLLSDHELMEEMRLNALHKISPTAWQNAAIAHVEFAKSILNSDVLELHYKVPHISMAHIKRMTTEMGMIQFADISDPDLASGYTLDDNARALIAVSEHFELTGKFEDLPLIDTYLNFILFCQQDDGTFLNYVTISEDFFEKNKDENLEDSNGRAIWALGEFLSLLQLMSFEIQIKIENAFKKSMHTLDKLQSPRAIAFAIKGLYHYHTFTKDIAVAKLIAKLGDNLASKYNAVATNEWQWYEEYLTYANSLLPEAMLLAYKTTGNVLYKEIAKKSFDFLLGIIFKTNQIKVISNQGWHHKGKVSNVYGEQPIEVAYTILALDCFYEEFKYDGYKTKLYRAFDWFLGANHLQQIIYNPCTGGCYDGLEEHQVNLNQGAESTLSYLLARLTIEKYL